MIADAAMKEVGELKSLTFLNIGQAQITDAGLQDLSQVESLSTLFVSNTSVTDEGIKQFNESLPHLEVLRN